VDVETAELIALEKGIELEINRPKDIEEDVIGLHKEAADDSTKLEPRAPVVTIMGHVDHGKTSLLDKIRQQYGLRSDVVSTEAGGITQVIRAWRVTKDNKAVTFLDTPGHEAFTKMRARGANVTDIAVIVVAADDGVMPQTEEAISHAKAANVSIVVAINKVDLPNANVKKTEQQLYSLSLLPDSMGGDCQFVYTSAATGQGIDELLETLSLVAEIKELRANPHKPAHGTCLEAYLSGDEGVMATILVQEGTLHRGEILICGAAHGRVRAMYDDLGRPIKEAGPSVPVRITGLDEVPNADDHFHVVAELTKAAEIAEKRRDRIRESQYGGRVAVKLEDIGKNEIKIAELKIILKAEAKGSVEAIKKELEKLVHDEVRVRVLHAGIGAISESDVSLALASPEDSMVIGFNVVPDNEAMKLAEERGIPIREYNIIYQLTNDIKSALEGKLKPREDIIHLGRAVIRETFKISKVGTIAGCYVTQGTIERSAKVRVIREGAVIYPPPERSASLESLKRFKDDVREVREGYDCGMKVAGYDDIKVGDVIEAYRIEQVQRTL
jgi:translation initiation factor IF-2